MAPPYLRVQEVFPTSLTLTWGELPPEKRNGIIREYEVEIKTGDGVYIVRNASEPKRSITIQDLKAYTTYGCRVRAYTISPGPYSADVYAETPEDSK